MKLNADDIIVGCGQKVYSMPELLSYDLSPFQQSNEAKVMTKYKPVAKKVRPVNVGLRPGEGLVVMEKEISELITQANLIRLTEERVGILKFGYELT